MPKNTIFPKILIRSRKLMLIQKFYIKLHRNKLKRDVTQFSFKIFHIRWEIIVVSLYKILNLWKRQSHYQVYSESINKRLIKYKNKALTWVLNKITFKKLTCLWFFPMKRTHKTLKIIQELIEIKVLYVNKTFQWMNQLSSLKQLRSALTNGKICKFSS